MESILTKEEEEMAISKVIKNACLIFILSILFSGKALAKDNDTFIPKEAKAYCIEVGKEYGICPELLMAIAEAESSGNAKAENGECKGIMQVVEIWHKERMERLGVSDIFDMEGNILVATDYLYELFEKYEDAGSVLMFYNGDNRAKSYLEGNTELSNYAKKILERSRELELLHSK